jgi:hypothetical protein
MVMNVPIRAALPPGLPGRGVMLMLSRRTCWVGTLVQAMPRVVVCSNATTGVATHSTTSREDAALVKQQMVQLVAQVRPQQLAKTHGNVRTTSP